jgi:RNA polymerase sigma-70 factor, ECF subfamily
LDEHDANDITQNVVLKIIRFLPKFWEKSSFSTWYYRIAYNESITYLKKKKDESDIDILEKIPDETNSIIQEIDSKYVSEIVTEKIHDLPVIERNIILYYYYDDLKIKDIAEIMNINENTVKTKLSRSKKSLSTQLKKYENNY